MTPDELRNTLAHVGLFHDDSLLLIQRAYNIAASDAVADYKESILKAISAWLDQRETLS